MGVSPIRFAGKDLYQPGYYGKRNTSSAAGGGASASTMVIVGECKGGIPFNATTDYPNSLDRINFVSNTNELNSIIRDGKAYYGALFGLTPSNEPGIGSPSQVGVVRINKATKGTSTVKDVDTYDVIELSSKGYGIYTNQIRRKISNGTNEGKKISVKFENQTVEVDDLTYNLFTIQYIGAGTACTLTIDPEGNLVTSVTGGPGSEDLTVDLTAFDTVGDLVAYLQSQTVYTTVLTGDGTLDITKMDKVIIGDAVDIKTEYQARATLQAVIDWFNLSSVYLDAKKVSLAENRIPANDADYVFLTGAVEGSAPVQQDWQDAFDQILATNDISLVGVMTDDPAVHAALSAHVTFMSGLEGRNERQAIVGSGDSDTKADKRSESAALNNSLVGYCGTEIKRYDKNGDLKTWAGYYGAALLLGLASGNDVTFAFTNKPLNIIGTRETYSPPDKNDYIKSGIMIIDKSSLGGFRCVRSVTTYQSSNIIENEFSAVRTSLFIVKDHRTYVESLIGEAGDDTALETVRNRAETRLGTYVKRGYFVTDPATDDAYRNFTFVVEGDVIKMSYEGTLVLPINFMLVDHNFVVVGVNR